MVKHGRLLFYRLLGLRCIGAVIHPVFKVWGVFAFWKMLGKGKQRLKLKGLYSTMLWNEGL